MAATAAPPKISASPDHFGVVDLRKILAERFPHPLVRNDTRLCTGVAALDHITGGGLPKSAITELIVPQMSAGSATLIHALLQCDSGETPAGPTGSPQDESVRLADRMPVLRPIALIDGRDSFDPASSQNSSLRQLFWIRCGNAIEAIKASDLLLRDGNFPLVIVDLVLNSPEELRKIPQTSWYRLQRLVELIPTACLVLSRQSMVSSAQLKIILENLWTLETLETEDAISQLRFHVGRSHMRVAPASCGLCAASCCTPGPFGRMPNDARWKRALPDAKPEAGTRLSVVN